MYGILKYHILTGVMVWNTEIVNGGYGTPLVWKNRVIVLTKFDGICALNKESGRIEWELSHNARIRSSLNIIDNLLCYTAGGKFFRVTYEGSILYEKQFENMFFYGTISPIIDVSEISTIDRVQACKYGNSYIFHVELKQNLISGYYCFPIEFVDSDTFLVNTLEVYLFRKRFIPAKYRIERFHKEIAQQSPLYSGAAIVQMLMNEYGKNISQKDFREMIDYVKEKSQWEDADFQTWRLILKRVLSNPGKTVQELIQSETKREDSLC